MDPNKKNFKSLAGQIEQLIQKMGGCFATDQITVEGKPVGFMYREKPDNEFDSGWRFFSGEESQAYVDDGDNLSLFEVNTICNYDQAIIPYLEAEVGTRLGRVPGTDRFEKE